MADPLTDQIKVLYAIALARGYREACSWLVHNHLAVPPEAVPAVVEDGLCIVTDRNGRRCTRRTGHTMRHRYGPTDKKP